jgi:hypothetical protein
MKKLSLRKAQGHRAKNRTIELFMILLNGKLVLLTTTKMFIKFLITSTKHKEMSPLVDYTLKMRSVAQLSIA